MTINNLGVGSRNGGAVSSSAPVQIYLQNIEWTLTMAENFVQPGETLTLPAPATFASGAGVLIGAIFGIAQGDAASGALVDITTQGVW